MEVHHAAVFDENVDARTSVKPAGGGPARVFGTPASCLPIPHQPAEGATARRALGDISNRAGPAAGGPHGAAPKAGGATPCAPGATTAHPPAKPHPSAVCAGLPISERTASFITDEVVALATVYAADGVEALAGHSGREQLAHALRDAQEQARQCASSLAAGGEWSTDQVRARPSQARRARPVPLSKQQLTRRPPPTRRHHAGAGLLRLRRAAPGHARL